MRGEAKQSGKVDVGFKRAEDGWHIVKFKEGIDNLKNKEQEILKTKAGDIKWKFPMVVDDPEDENNGIEIDFITQENKRGEDMICSFLSCVGLIEKFEKAFPGDISLFEDKVMQKIKTQFPGQVMRVKTKQSVNKNDPDNPYVNIVGFGPMSIPWEKLEAELFGDKKEGGKKEEKKTATPPPADDDF